MSRTAILTFAAAATVAVAGLASSSSYARGFAGGGAHFAAGGNRVSAGSARLSGGGTHLSVVPTHLRGHTPLARINNPGRPGHLPPIHIGHHPHGHHLHWVFRDGRWFEIDDVAVNALDVAPAAVPVSGPCTCLTKNYTPTGLVVFADICTKESASAPVDGSAADATTAPTTPPVARAPANETPTASNYGGRTYQDYLAANPPASTAAAQKN